MELQERIEQQQAEIEKLKQAIRDLHHTRHEGLRIMIRQLKFYLLFACLEYGEQGVLTKEWKPMKKFDIDKIGIEIGSEGLWLGYYDDKNIFHEIKSWEDVPKILWHL